MKNILDTPINDIVALVEDKEVARDALPLPVGNVSSSSYRRNQPNQSEAPQVDVPVPCPGCHKPFLRFSEGRNGRNKKPHKLCIECYRIKRSQDKTNSNRPTKPDDRILLVSVPCLVKYQESPHRNQNPPPSPTRMQLLRLTAYSQRASGGNRNSRITLG